MHIHFFFVVAILLLLLLLIEGERGEKLKKINFQIARLFVCLFVKDVHKIIATTTRVFIYFKLILAIIEQISHSSHKDHHQIMV